MQRLPLSDGLEMNPNIRAADKVKGKGGSGPAAY